MKVAKLLEIGWSSWPVREFLTHLSGGQKQRVAICCSLHLLPTIQNLISDESASALDQTTKQILALLQS